jgi:hypothetical protein
MNVEQPSFSGRSFAAGAVPFVPAQASARTRIYAVPAASYAETRGGVCHLVVERRARRHSDRAAVCVFISLPRWRLR